MAANQSTPDYILYAHDDFYFCPNWDQILKNEIDLIGHNEFYLSGTMINNGQIEFDCGKTLETFEEKKLLDNYKNYNHYNFQGSTWAPHVIHKEVWNKVGGFSEEFFPGSASDPDFNMKLWKSGIRIFKGINDFKVYHFGSKVLRKKINKLKISNKFGSIGAKIFLLKWGISIKFFKRFYLNSNSRYIEPLNNPKIDIKYIFYFIICKINYYYLKIFYRKYINKNIS